MRFSSTILSLTLLTLAAPSPMPKKKATATKAAAATSIAAATAGESVLTASDYNTISISGGIAGNAEAEANALFSAIDMNNLAAVSAADLKIIKAHTMQLRMRRSRHSTQLLMQQVVMLLQLSR